MVSRTGGLFALPKYVEIQEGYDEAENADNMKLIEEADEQLAT